MSKDLFIPIFLTFAVVAFFLRIREIISHKGLRGEVSDNWTLQAMVGCHLLFFFGSILELVLWKRDVSLAVTMAGLTSFLCGLLLRKWAIKSLGPLWSVSIEIRSTHQLITSGPYRYCRHPNYLAILFEMFGFCLAANAHRTLMVSSLLYIPILLVRIRLEEAAMTRKFGSAYEGYKHRTPALVPFLI